MVVPVVFGGAPGSLTCVELRLYPIFLEQILRESTNGNDNLGVSTLHTEFG